MMVSGGFADAINSQLNPKAVRKAVSSFATAVAAGAQTNDKLGYEKIKSCLLKYVSKDGKYDTNITVKQFGSCCMEGLRNPESCKKMIEDVVFEHNMLAASMRPVPVICTWQDLNNMPLASAGHYVYINGAKKCAATECMPGAYLARSVQPNRYGQSDGYCIKGEDPWILQNGKYVLKTDVTKQTPSDSDKGTEQKQPEHVVSDEKQDTEFLPDALMKMDFYKQYCVGAGNLKCIKSSDGAIRASFECTVVGGVKHDEMSRDAVAVCNGTFVAKTVTAGNENSTSDNANVVISDNGTIATLHSDKNLLSVEGVNAEDVQIKVNIQEPSREEMLNAAKKNAADSALLMASDATKGSEKTKAKIDALERQEQVVRAYIDAEDNYNLDDIDASIAYAEKVKGQQKELQKLQKQEAELNKKLEKQEKKESECAARHGTYKAGSCWCGSLILTGNMDCAEIEAKKQARQDKQAADKAKKALEQEKSNLEKEIGNLQKQISDLTKSAKSAKENNAKKLEQKKKELQDLDNKIDEARRLSDKMHASGDTKLADKLKELKNLTDKRPALAQQVADLENAQSYSNEDQIRGMMSQIEQKQKRVAEINIELSGN